MNQVVDEVFTLVANQAAIQGVEVEKDLARLPMVEADFGQLRQAFINIVINAIEAMRQGRARSRSRRGRCRRRTRSRSSSRTTGRASRRS